MTQAEVKGANKVQTRDFVGENKLKLCNNENAFQSIFGVPLRRFWHSLFGFDIVGFDDFLHTPDGQSTASCITEHYGKEACALIETLL